MAQVLDTSTTLTDYTETVQLDGVQYVLRFRWNSRMRCWFLDVADADGNLLIAGRRCTVDSLLIGQFHHIDGAPLNELVPFDTTLLKRDPGLAELGDRVLMVYKGNA